jgi:hypothetical protein
MSLILHVSRAILFHFSTVYFLTFISFTIAAVRYVLRSRTMYFYFFISVLLLQQFHLVIHLHLSIGHVSPD